MPSKHKVIVASPIKIKRNDQVVVIAGKDKGKKGRVLRVIVAKQRVLVEGVGMAKKHVKPNQQTGKAGGIIEQELPIHVSNVMLLDSDGKGTKIGYRVEGEKKTRFARTNGGTLADVITKK